MQVQELIERLEQYDDEMEVTRNAGGILDTVRQVESAERGERGEVVILN